MELLNGKWKGMLIFRLHEQSLRFNEIKKLLPGVSNRTLARIIKEMEHDGLLIKIDASGKTKIFTYRLSPLSLQLFPTLNMIREWGAVYPNVQKK